MRTVLITTVLLRSDSAVDGESFSCGLTDKLLIHGQLKNVAGDGVTGVDVTYADRKEHFIFEGDTYFDTIDNTKDCRILFTTPERRGKFLQFSANGVGMDWIRELDAAFTEGTGIDTSTMKYSGEMQDWQITPAS